MFILSWSLLFWCLFGVNESYTHFHLAYSDIFPQVFNWYQRDHDGPQLSFRPLRANDTRPGDGSPDAGF